MHDRQITAGASTSINLSLSCRALPKAYLNGGLMDGLKCGRNFGFGSFQQTAVTEEVAPKQKEGSKLI